MVRIRIEDLAAIENPTQEELEEIFGAGRRSFTPTLESLESREMMDAGFGRAVLTGLVAPPNTGAPSVAHVRELSPAAFAPAQVADLDKMFTALARAPPPRPGAAQSVVTTTQQDVPIDATDASSLQKQTMEVFTKRVLDANVLANSWGFKQIVGATNTIVGNEVQVKLRVKFANIGGSGETTLQWNYSFTRFDGNDKVFKLESTSHSYYQGGWGENNIDERMMNIVSRHDQYSRTIYELRVNRPNAVPYSADMRKAADEAIQRIGARFGDSSVNGRHLVGKGEVVAVTAQGFTIKFRVQSNWMQWLGRDPGVESQVTTEVSLTFKYSGTVNGFERFTCEDVKAGVVSVVSRDRYNGNARYDHPTYDVGVVVINEDGLKSDYRTFYTYGDSRLLESSVGAIVQERLKDLNIHGQPDGWDGSAVGRQTWGAVEKIAGGYRVTFKVDFGVEDSGGNFIDTLGLGSYDFQLVIKDTGEVQCTGANRMAKEFVSAADAEKFQNNVAADVSARMRGPAMDGL